MQSDSCVINEHYLLKDLIKRSLSSFLIFGLHNSFLEAHKIQLRHDKPYHSLPQGKKTLICKGQQVTEKLVLTGEVSLGKPCNQEEASMFE